MELVSESLEDETKLEAVTSSHSILARGVSCIINGKNKCRDHFISEYVTENIDLCLLSLKLCKEKYFKELVLKCPSINSEEEEMATYFIDTISLDQGEDEGLENDDNEDQLQSKLISLAQQGTYYNQSLI